MEPGPDRCAVQRPLKRSVTPSLSASTPVIDVVIERRVVAGVETVDHVCIDAKRLQRIARVEQGERPSVAIGPSHLAQNVAQAHGVVPQRFALRLVSFHDPDVLIAPAMRRYPRRCPETSSSTVFRDVILGLVPRTGEHGPCGVRAVADSDPLSSQQVRG